eukprot:10302100-Ditylum_brightwellii.AAC.2
MRKLPGGHIPLWYWKNEWKYPPPPTIPRQTPLVGSRNPGPLSTTPTATSGTTVSLLTSSTGRGRSSTNMTSVFAAGDPNYARQDASVGAVIGTSVEQKLKYGAS